MIEKFNVPKAVLKFMQEKNPKWRKAILEQNKWDLGSLEDQLIIARDPESNEEILLEISRITKSAIVKKTILAHPKCTVEMARNMF